MLNSSQDWKYEEQEWTWLKKQALVTVPCLELCNVR